MGPVLLEGFANTLNRRELGGCSDATDIYRTALISNILTFGGVKLSLLENC